MGGVKVRNTTGAGAGGRVVGVLGRRERYRMKMRRETRRRFMGVAIVCLVGLVEACEMGVGWDVHFGVRRSFGGFCGVLEMDVGYGEGEGP